MDGIGFEYYCAHLLELDGFSEVQVTQASGDQGIDILAKKNDLKYAVQCKFYREPVGNFAVQAVYAGKDFYNCDKAAVMTNSTFTTSAQELAYKLNVELWGGVRITNSMEGLEQNYKVGYGVNRGRSTNKETVASALGRDVGKMMGESFRTINKAKEGGNSTLKKVGGKLGQILGKSIFRP